MSRWKVLIDTVPSHPGSLKTVSHSQSYEGSKFPRAGHPNLSPLPPANFRPSPWSKNLEKTTKVSKIDPLQIRQAAISPNKSSEIRETGDVRAKLIPNFPHISPQLPAIFRVKSVAVESSKQALSVATSSAQNGTVCTNLRDWPAGTSILRNLANTRPFTRPACNRIASIKPVYRDIDHRKWWCYERSTRVGLPQMGNARTPRGTL